MQHNFTQHSVVSNLHCNLHQGRVASAHRERSVNLPQTMEAQFQFVCALHAAIVLNQFEPTTGSTAASRKLKLSSARSCRRCAFRFHPRHLLCLIMAPRVRARASVHPGNDDSQAVAPVAAPVPLPPAADASPSISEGDFQGLFSPLLSPGADAGAHPSNEAWAEGEQITPVRPTDPIGCAVTGRCP